MAHRYFLYGFSAASHDLKRPCFITWPLTDLSLKPNSLFRGQTTFGMPNAPPCPNASKGSTRSGNTQRHEDSPIFQGTDTLKGVAFSNTRDMATLEPHSGPVNPVGPFATSSDWIPAHCLDAVCKWISAPVLASSSHPVWCSAATFILTHPASTSVNVCETLICDSCITRSCFV